MKGSWAGCDLSNLLIAAVGQGSIGCSVGTHALHAGLQGREAVCAVLPQRGDHAVYEVDLQLALHPLILGIHVQGGRQA